MPDIGVQFKTWIFRAVGGIWRGGGFVWNPRDETLRRITFEGNLERERGRDGDFRERGREDTKLAKS